MSMFGMIPSAYAQTASGSSPGAADMLQNFAPILIVVGIFYFLLIRPQQQRAKQLKTQLSQLRRGDSVVTSGGIIGTIARVVNDDEITLEIAEGVRVRVIRSTITGIASKSEPRGDSGKTVANDKDVEADPAPAKPPRRGKVAAATAESKPQS